MTEAAILAGGRARRFGGRDKSRLLVGGRTILERQIEALTPCVSRIMLVGSTGDAAGDPRLVAVADRVGDRGPLGGLDAALDAAGGPVLLLACDMPFVTTPLLADLIAKLDGVDAVVPRTERGYHPLCGVFAPQCRGPVRARLDAGHLRLRDLLTDLRVRTVDGDDLARFGEPNWLLANVNTQADLDALKLQNH